MKTLSIRQPWAELIVSGLKDIENRDWYTKYRGEILVHASMTFDKASFQFLQNRFGLFLGKTKEDFQFGGIVVKTTIIDCVSKSNSQWFIGKYGLVLENSQRLEFFPVSGQLKFFEVDYHAKNKIYLCEYEDSRNWQIPNSSYQIRLSHPLEEKNRRKPVRDKENNIPRLIRFTELDLNSLGWEILKSK